MANKSMVSFRLRKIVDDDIAAIIEKRTGEEINDICRTALRNAFGITVQKQKVVQFVDVPVKVWKPKAGGKA